MNFAQGLQSFYHRCLAINVTNLTLSNYRSNLLDFHKFFTNAGLKDLEQIDNKFVRDYMVSLKARQLSPVTIEDRFRILKTFFTYHEQEGNIAVSPMQGMIKPKIPKIHARTFTNEEINAIMKYFRLDDFIGYRNYTIMCLFYGTGIRERELLNLTVFDIHMDIDTITVLGKGNKERHIPITKVLKRILNTYIKRREDYLLFSRHNSPALIISHTGKQLTVSGLQVVFSHLKRDLGFPAKRLSPHTWRHTFAKNFLLNGGNVFALQRLLGHEDIETTKIYIDYTINEMKTQNDSYNPLDNNRWQYY